MSTSDKTFTQVKDILRKLERSIDQAREKRLHLEDEDDLGSTAAPSPRPAEPARAQPTQAAPIRHESPRTPPSGWIAR
jgi:hypothetical protein